MDSPSQQDNSIMDLNMDTAMEEQDRESQTPPPPVILPYKSVWAKFERRAKRKSLKDEFFDEKFCLLSWRVGLKLCRHEYFDDVSDEVRNFFMEWRIWMYCFPETQTFPGSKDLLDNHFIREMNQDLYDGTALPLDQEEIKRTILQHRKEKEESVEDAGDRENILIQDRDDREVLATQGPAYYAIHMEMRFTPLHLRSPPATRITALLKLVEGGDEFNCRHKYSLLCPRIPCLREALRRPFDTAAQVQLEMGVWFKDNLDHVGSSTREVRIWVGPSEPLEYRVLDREPEELVKRMEEGFRFIKFWLWVAVMDYERGRGELMNPLIGLGEARELYYKNGGRGLMRRRYIKCEDVVEVDDDDEGVEGAGEDEQ